MARGTQLEILRVMLRNELRMGSDPALSPQYIESLDQALRAAQEDLYDRFQWDFAVMTVRLTLTADVSVYSLPSNLNPDSIVTVAVRWQNIWRNVPRGIDVIPEHRHSDTDLVYKDDPIRRWDWAHDGADRVFSVWPTPTQEQLVAIVGKKKLPPLMADADQAMMDDWAIVYLAASNKALDEKERAKFAQMAANRVATLRTNVQAGRKVWSLGWDGVPRERLRARLTQS